MHTPEDSELGKGTNYPKYYDKSILFGIPRLVSRKEMGIDTELPFYGTDIWNAWEISWLNPRGKPCVAIGTIEIPAQSPNLVESKSLKLYLNSLNSTKFANIDEVCSTIVRDLSETAGIDIKCKLTKLSDFTHQIDKNNGISVDDIDIEVSDFNYDPKLLKATKNKENVTETLTSDLLKSNCPVTNQPDWATVTISYVGQKLDRESLLRFVLSFREHNEFHEQCAERIFLAVKEVTNPTHLVVECRYTRRGGLDINPIRRLNFAQESEYKRFVRQ